MANEIIRPSELPSRTDPVASEVVPSDNSSTVAGVSWEDGVNSAVPPASQAEAEAGVINSKRMTPLTTKQAIDAQVDPKISSAIGSLNLGSASQASVGDFATAAQGALADTAVQPSDPALIPPGGSTSQVLIKSSNTDYDTEWTTSAAATAVSYAPQVLTDAQKLQAQNNLSLANFKTVPLLLADELMSYTADPGKVQVGPGDVIEAQGFRYEVAASSATDHHVETAGGVKLYVAEITPSLQAFGVGLGLGDDAPALLRALVWADGKTLDGRNTTIILNSELSYDGPVDLPDATWDLSGGGTVRFMSDPEPISALASDIRGGASTVAFSAVHGLQRHDVIVAFNPTQYSWSNAQSYYHDGCMFEVDLIDSPTALKVFGVPPDTYMAADMDMYRLTGRGVRLDGSTIIPNPDELINVWIGGHVGVRLDKVTVKGGDVRTGIEVWRSYDVLVVDPDCISVIGDAYPIAISNSQKVRVRGLNNKSSRHVIGLGGRSGPCSVPYRDVIISDSILFNRASMGIGSADMHGNGENIQYVNCIMQTGANVAGKNIKLKNCTIYGRDIDEYDDAQCIHSSGALGGVYSFEDCRMIFWGTAPSWGVINIISETREDDLTIHVKNCVVENRAETPSSVIRLVRLVNGDTPNPHRIDIDIDGLEYISPVAPFAYCQISGQADISGQATVAIEGVRGPGGTLFLTQPVNADIPLRLQKQSGRVSLETNTSTGTVTQSIPYPSFTYPRSPVAQVSMIGTPTTGGDRIAAFASVVGNSSITVGLVRTDGTSNFIGVVTRTVSWEVGIADF